MRARSIGVTMAEPLISSLAILMTETIASRVVKYLIDGYKIDKFRALYIKTPLVPQQRDAGSPDRWNEVYGLSLTDLELQWKSLISALSCP
jgi:hypothetical protein